MSSTITDSSSAMPLPFGLTHVKVIGVGGGGCNTVMRILGSKVPGVEFFCANTDANALSSVQGATVIRIGETLTQGYGAGGKMDVGLKAAQESQQALRDALQGANLVFIAAGMGGGTGSGAAPLVAEVAKSLGALTVAIVTTPFSFEGAKRAATATQGMMALKNKVDTLIVVANDRLLALAGEGASVQDAFKKADEVSAQAIIAVSRVINVPGQINVDFADLKVIMSDAGTGIMAIGRANGKDRALKATKAAISNPLLNMSMEGAQGVLFAFTGGPNLGLAEVNECGQLISETVDPDARIFFGMNIDPKMGDDVELVLIATHLPETASAYPAPHLAEHQEASYEPGKLPPFMSRK